ncbi:MAG: helicase-associated domain-containing protein [Anaerolineales bacterium]|nr:helicase-associated domain-containing protein [Anaerolineales bacterium]
MPPLERVLIDYDLGLLRLMAELGGVELTAPSQREAAGQLARRLLEPERLAANIAALPVPARAALEALRGAGGRLPRARFTRAYGEVRAMGQARREREQPWRHAPSPAETLWYRALTAHAFFESEAGPQEFTFIPEDLLKLLPAAPDPPPAALPPAAPPGQSAEAPAAVRAGAFQLADDVVTLLAYAQRVPLRLEPGTLTTRQPDVVRRFLHAPEALDLAFQLAIQLKFLTGAPLRPDPAPARSFLELTRLAQTQTLAAAWRASTDWNDLLRLPGLVFEGHAWRNDPVLAREAILAQLAAVPAGEWWSLESFVAAIKERTPDFQRPAGDYDAWYIRDAETDAYLRGFEHWERVDGALVRWFIEGPLHWLGLVDVAAPRAAPAPAKPRSLRRAGRATAAFRVTPAGAAFLGRGAWPAAGDPAAATHVHIGLDAVISAPAALAPYQRFRLARVAKWVGLEADTYTYRLAPSALRRARQQGVEVGRIVDFLREIAAEPGLPPSVLAALERWARAGQEAAVQEFLVLRVKSPDVLEALRRTPRVQDYLGRPLGPTAIEVRREAADRLRGALAELGILTD